MKNLLNRLKGLDRLDYLTAALFVLICTILTAWVVGIACFLGQDGTRLMAFTFWNTALVFAGAAVFVTIILAFSGGVVGKNVASSISFPEVLVPMRSEAAPPWREGMYLPPSKRGPGRRTTSGVRPKEGQLGNGSDRRTGTDDPFKN